MCPHFLLPKTLTELASKESALPQVGSVHNKTDSCLGLRQIIMVMESLITPALVFSHIAHCTKSCRSLNDQQNHQS